MSYTLDTTTYSSFQVLTIDKRSIYLPKKAIASIDLQATDVTVKFEDGSQQSESLGKSKAKKGGSRVVDNRHRNWRRRG